MSYSFSIIIPHKNNSTLLQRCLDSIPQREDTEVIVVDDNSDSGIVDFDHFPGKDRPNTKVVFDKSGKGAGRARNVGLKNAQGKWLIFSDADDFFTPNISLIMDKVLNSDADIVFFKTESRNGETMQIHNETNARNLIIDRAIIEGDDVVRFRSAPPWGKVIRHSFVTTNAIHFEETPCGNDVFFSGMCDFYAKKIDLFQEVGYCYMVNSNSLWHNRNLTWAETRFRVDIRMYSFLNKHKEKEGSVFFLKRANYFLDQIILYSKTAYLKNFLIYGVYIRSLRIMFWECPKIAMRLLYDKLAATVK